MVTLILLRMWKLGRANARMASWRTLLRLTVMVHIFSECSNDVILASTASNVTESFDLKLKIWAIIVSTVHHILQHFRFAQFQCIVQQFVFNRCNIM